MAFRPGKPGPPAASGAMAAALAHHQAGRLGEAKALYLQVLAGAPQHFDAMHLLGVVALQSDQLDEARELIGAALRLNPRAAAAHSNLGTVHLRSGRLVEAAASLDQAIKLQPGFADALLNLGSVLRQMGRISDSAPVLKRAAAAAPKSPEAANLLGATLLDLGDAPGAIKAFEAAVRLRPQDADAWSNLGSARLNHGEPERALECCDKALTLDPRSSGANTNKGMALARLGRARDARACFERAVAIDAGSAVARANLGAFLREEGEADAAIVQLEEARRLAPDLLAPAVTLMSALQDRGDSAEALTLGQRLVNEHGSSAAAHGAFGALLVANNDLSGGVEVLRKAVALPGAGAEASLALANALMAQGKPGEAVGHYQRAVSLDPMHLAARWGLAMSNLRPIYADAKELETSRNKFRKALSELDAWITPERARAGFRAVGSTQPFYLAYHPFDNRELLAEYGRLCARLMAAWEHDAWPEPSATTSGPIRVGIASAHVRDHSVWNAITRGWVEHLDPQRFELHIFQLGSGTDAETARARRHARAFIHAPTSLAAWSAAISRSALDVLIYPEIGMDAMTTKLAALRLAPVQMAAWGHPETTGLPTIDVYLSAQGFESPMAAAHYTERLVALPNLGVFSEPLAVDPIAPELTALGLPADEPLLLCPGTPFKYSPAHDRVWVEIARRLARGRLVFFRSNHAEMARQLEDRMKRAFSLAGVDYAARVCFIPTLDRARFFGLMERADLFLDTLGFSGFNTAIQAIQCGMPIIAREGPFMRGRLASALVRRLGIDELVATDDDAYIELAVRLAADAPARAALRRRVESSRAILFNDLEPVRALERTIVEAVQRSIATGATKRVSR